MKCNFARSPSIQKQAQAELFQACCICSHMLNTQYGHNWFVHIVHFCKPTLSSLTVQQPSPPTPDTLPSSDISPFQPSWIQHEIPGPTWVPPLICEGRKGGAAMSAFNAISLLFIIHTTGPSLSTSTPQLPDCHLLIAAADTIATASDCRR